jgi:two-component system sensor histidine kinase UhpB
MRNLSYSPKIAQGMTDDDQEVLESGRPKLNIVEQYESASGIRWVQTDKVPICDKNGITVGLVGFAQDITERKQAEEALRKSEAILNETGFIARIGGWEHDLVSGQATWTKALYDIDELESGTPPGPNEHLDYYPPRDRAILARAYQRAAETGEPFDLELQVYTAKKRLIWGRVIGRPIMQGGKCIRMVGTFQDITDRKRAEQERERLFQEVQSAHGQLQTLSRHLMDAQENERRQIARELHDEIGQVLTAIKTNLQAIQLAPEPATLQARLEESGTIVDHALEQIRTLALDLRPSLLDDFGLESALEWYLARQGRRAGFVAEFSAALPETRLPSALESTCFRVVQAAVTNAERYAHATKVQVLLRAIAPIESDGITKLELVVRDDGVGFDVSTAMERSMRGASLGLVGMQERVRLAGGEITIESVHGQGTEIRAQFPLSTA